MLIKLIAELVAVVVIFAIIVRYITPKFIIPMLAKQQELISKQVEESEEAQRKLAEAERSYQGAVTDARTEAAQIRENARAEAQRTVEDLKIQAQQESERIVTRGEEQLAAQRSSVVRELRTEIGSLALDLSDQIISQRLSDEAHVSSTVDAFLAGLEAKDDVASRKSNGGADS